MNLLKVFSESYDLLFAGFATTIEITVLSLLNAMVLGMIICLFNLSSSRALKAMAKIYIWLIRGTPMLVQAFYVYFAIPQLIQTFTGAPFRIDIFTAGVVTLSMNSGAYISEIFRGSIEAVDKGQMEAAISLGMGYAMSMRLIIFPQAVRICLPSLVNQFIITLKDSTILYAIGLPEIMNRAKVYVGRTMLSFATYTWVAIFFLAIVTALSLVSRYVEGKLKR